MKKCKINEDVVLRKYGKIILGYFSSDPKMRYFTIEGVALQIIEALHEEKTEEMLKTELKDRGIEEKLFHLELEKLVKLSIVEVVEHDEIK